MFAGFFEEIFFDILRRNIRSHHLLGSFFVTKGQNPHPFQITEGSTSRLDSLEQCVCC